MKFAVIFTYSFDPYIPVFLFEKEEDAVAFLRSSYREELRIDREENGWRSYGELDADGWYAKIVCEFSDCEDVTEFRIGYVESTNTKN